MSTGSLVLQDLPTGQAIVEVYHILCSLGIRHNCHTERTTATSASRPTETEQHQLSKEEKEEAECQRKFRAVPVLVQVFLHLYDAGATEGEEGRPWTEEGLHALHAEALQLPGERWEEEREADGEHLKGVLPKKTSLEMLLRYRKWCYKCIIILSKSIFSPTEFCMLCRGGAAQDDMHPAEGPGELEEVDSTYREPNSYWEPWTSQLPAH